MNKTIILKALFVCLFFAALVSCSEISPVNNNNNNEGNGARIEKLGINLEPGTKVTLSNDVQAIFAWEIGDIIAVWTGTSATTPGAYGYQECTVVDDGGNSISVDVAPGTARYNYAIYPASVRDNSNYGQSTLKVKLPSEYTLAKVSGTKTPLPMVAVNTNGNDKLTFYNVAGLLRLTITNIPTTASYLKLDFDGHQVHGSFTVSNPGTTSPSISTSTESSNDKIKITDLGGATSVTVNIPIPTGAYGDIIVSAWNGSDVPVKAQVQPFSYSSVRAHGKKVSTELKLGIFSGAAGKYLVFAPGNLQAVFASAGSSCTWKFADHQYDYVGNQSANKNINGSGSVSVAGTVDLFGWVGNSAAQNDFGINNTYTASDYGTSADDKLKTDWGANAIGPYTANTWRTPTGGNYSLHSGDWYYLVSGRSNANTLYKRSTVCDKKGVIFMPDGWSGSLASSYTSEQWAALENEGALFLPCAGERWPMAGPSTVNNVNSTGYYWSSVATEPSSQGDGMANQLRIYSSSAPENTALERSAGCSVRLVRDIE
jgi:hypothetical protein